MIRLPFLQILKHQIHRILELLVILPNLHGIDELDESRKVLFLLRCLIMNVSNERTVEQRLCLVPERIPSLAFSPGIRHQGCGQLQDVLFRADIGKRVIVHRLFEVDRIEEPDAVFRLNKGVPHLKKGRSFGVG